MVLINLIIFVILCLVVSLIVLYILFSVEGKGQWTSWSLIYTFYVVSPSLSIYFSKKKAELILLLLCNFNLIVFVVIFHHYYSTGDLGLFVENFNCLSETHCSDDPMIHVKKLEEDEFRKGVATLTGASTGMTSCWQVTQGLPLSGPQRLALAAGVGSASGLAGRKMYAIAINRSNEKFVVAKKSLKVNTEILEVLNKNSWQLGKKTYQEVINQGSNLSDEMIGLLQKKPVVETYQPISLTDLLTQSEKFGELPPFLYPSLPHNLENLVYTSTVVDHDLVTTLVKGSSFIL